MVIINPNLPIRTSVLADCLIEDMIAIEGDLSSGKFGLLGNVMLPRVHLHRVMLESERNNTNSKSLYELLPRCYDVVFDYDYCFCENEIDPHTLLNRLNDDEFNVTMSSKRWYERRLKDKHIENFKPTAS